MTNFGWEHDPLVLSIPELFMGSETGCSVFISAISGEYIRSLDFPDTLMITSFSIDSHMRDVDYFDHSLHILIDPFEPIRSDFRSLCQPIVKYIQKGSCRYTNEFVGQLQIDLDGCNWKEQRLYY